MTTHKHGRPFAVLAMISVHGIRSLHNLFQLDKNVVVLVLSELYKQEGDFLTTSFRQGESILGLVSLSEFCLKSLTASSHVTFILRKGKRTRESKMKKWIQEIRENGKKTKKQNKT